MMVAVWRQRLQQVLEAPWCQRLVIGVIAFNALTLGLEALPKVVQAYGPWLWALDRAALVFFVVEISLRLVAYGWAFFRQAWNWFDFLIVAIALIPAQGAWSVLRALRILRALRLVAAVPSMRRVVEALLGALPGMASIIALLTLILYIAAVMATKIFGQIAPHWFGDLWLSLFTMFQIMTMEAWAEITRSVMATAPWAWVFFVGYMLISTFAVLNLFIAVVVNAMQEHVAREQQGQQAQEQAQLVAELAEIKRALQRLEVAQQRCK